jgi:hypothetical protein
MLPNFFSNFLAHLMNISLIVSFGWELSLRINQNFRTSRLLLGFERSQV